MIEPIGRRTRQQRSERARAWREGTVENLRADPRAVRALCTPLDTLARDSSLGCTQVGDLVAIFQPRACGPDGEPPRLPEPLDARRGPGRSWLQRAHPVAWELGGHRVGQL